MCSPWYNNKEKGMASRIKKLSHENKRRLIHLPSITIEDKSEVGGPQKPHYTNKERYYSIHILKRISNKYY